ncbi:MAG: hypothetical protein K0S93_1531, partial [Nitrososphaeraceae archaeon]|nr:hypothetical protein [Nitrososphaeraceae archaeon]
MYHSHYLTNISIMSIIVVMCIGLIYITNVDSVDAQSNKKEPSIPILRDSNLKTELIVDKLKFPSGMEFIGNDDLL